MSASRYDLIVRMVRGTNCVLMLICTFCSNESVSVWVQFLSLYCLGGQQQRVCRGGVRHSLSARELLIENVGAHLHSQAQFHGAAQSKTKTRQVISVHLYLQLKLKIRIYCHGEIIHQFKAVISV